MSTLKEALVADRTGYTSRDVPSSRVIPRIDLQPVFNPILRCPLPPTTVSPDSLRQFYRGDNIPQFRLLAPNPVSNNSGGTVINKVAAIINNSSITNNSNSTLSLKSVQSSITTNVLNPGDIFTGSILLAKSFQLLSAATSSAARVELYGTAQAQSIDIGRNLDESFPAGTTQNVITDIALDSSPFVWSWQNKVGSNADSPQTSLVYITVTNIGNTSNTITVTIVYIPLEQG